ncbi:class I SAM-dependent methyltransferase [Kitasatospora phosalacinea]|uniref:Methyltransferase n=1 Tax=Kitasatospora phosalacinea TaxID=2065 RepID=A0A9W6UPU6_9ACTN|nr:class I SAM-dependent methyltransferase [Kitasatospora phosalacinea]GLW55738.1 methyltransferase [Kitasatospora phosalacinea]
MAGAVRETGSYLFDNGSAHAAGQHRCLAAWLDPVSFGALRAGGVGPGMRCLDVGTGAGSVALWLAERVAPGGSVLATDLAPLPVPVRPGLTVLRHDVVRDELPPGAFDLVHARLVLSHLPEREAVLARLFAALRPGGVLHLLEFDAEYAPVLTVPDERARELYERYQRAKLRAFRARGSHQGWGRECAGALVRAGFTGVEAEVRIGTLAPGTPQLEMQLHNTWHLREPLLREGLGEDELAELRGLFADPRFRACSNVVYAVRGRRP